MKKDKLYTVNKWNQPMFADKNLFLTGGEMELQNGIPVMLGYTPQQLLGSYQASSFTLPDIPKGGLTLSKDALKGLNNTPKKNILNDAKFGDIINSAATAASPLLTSLIGGGYSTGGVGEGIAGVGNIAGDIVGAIPGVGALASPIIKAATGVAGGLVNRGWGTKENKTNINTLEQNTAQAQAAGNALVGSTTSSDFFNNAGLMTTGTGFSTTDLVKGGWFSKGKARRKGQKYLDKEANALAMQNQGMVTGANNVDSYMDDAVMSNFAAFGGPLDYTGITGNIGNMGAIEYGFMSDYLTAKNKQNSVKDKLTGLTGFNGFGEGGSIEIKHPGRLTELKKRTGKTEAELWAEGRPEVRKMITFARNARKWKKAYGGFLDAADNLFALGGDIQTNGADFTTGMKHISAGQSHEENPNGGVQVGVDPQGTPNLVEENETIFNDYVYSDRIPCDEETKKKFHIGKKRKITFADLSKKLEKEASERPNDPISQAGLKAQMEDLANEQERQKQEMEAARAREAFEALSPEEKVEAMTMLQQRAQQEQAAQEQAIMEQQAVAQQQPVEQVMPEETAVAGQEEMAEPSMEQEPVMAAEGGEINTFAKGGKKNAGNFINGTISENWNTYTRGGLRDYLQNIVARINAAPDEQTKNDIRQEAINTVAGIQKAYAAAYQDELSPVTEREEVKTLQELFNAPGGNKYFTDIANNINIPYGADTGDRVDRGWVDSLWGPRTSIRNWGSTEYGDADYYKDIADLATQAGMVYAPNADWTYNNNTLYGLSIPGAQTPAPANIPADSNTPAPAPNADNTSVPGRYGNMPWAPEAKAGTAGSVANNGNVSAGTPVASKAAEDEYNVAPVYRNDKLRYAGLIGPAVGLGMQVLGIGRPDTKGLDGVLEGYDRTGAALADYKPIGDYLRYSPMDIWAEQNRLNANARATDRALINNSAPVGTRAAGLLANEYNNQIGSGELYRKALEYNDALRERTAAFNRGTNQFNAEAYNRAALQNAEIINRDRQLRAQLGMQAAAQKADMDAGWYNGIYGNVAGLFKGIGDLGRENAQHNMIAEMAADGIFGTMSPKTNTGKRGKYLTWTKKNPKACGGKINKKKGK